MGDILFGLWWVLINQPATHQRISFYCLKFSCPSGFIFPDFLLPLSCPHSSSNAWYLPYWLYCPQISYTLSWVAASFSHFNGPFSCFFPTALYPPWLPEVVPPKCKWDPVTPQFKTLSWSPTALRSRVQHLLTLKPTYLSHTWFALTPLLIYTFPLPDRRQFPKHHLIRPSCLYSCWQFCLKLPSPFHSQLTYS